MRDDDISLVIEFLDRYGPEVSGRGLIGLRSDQTAMIERFIAGRCSEAERQELSRFLQLHPAWIRWIADRMKSGRGVDDAAVLSGE